MGVWQQDDGSFFYGAGIHSPQSSSYGKLQSNLTMGSYEPRDSLLRETHKIPLSIARGDGSRMTALFFTAMAAG
jgi:hypothetical protein